MCFGRGEPQLCEYEDGSHPPSLPTTVAPFSNLQARVAELERLISPSLHLEALTSNSSKANDVERAARALEAMAAGGVGVGKEEIASSGDHRTPTRDFRKGTWPTIIDYSTERERGRSLRWYRDMGDIVAAVPREDLTMFLVDRFFADSGKLCARFIGFKCKEGGKLIS